MDNIDTHTQSSPSVTTSVTLGGQPAVLVKAPTNGIGTAGGVLGIVGMSLIWVPFLGGLLCLLATILGGVGIAKGKKEQLPAGMSITGVVLGAVGILIYLVVTVIAVAASSSAGA